MEGWDCERNTIQSIAVCKIYNRTTVEPPNNGHIGDEHFVHCSEVVPSSEVEIVYRQGVCCMEFVHSSECPLFRGSTVFEILLLYTL